MKAISTTLGSGAIKHVQLQDVIHEDWVELLSLNLCIKTSAEFVDDQWHCPAGINCDTMPMLNQEFNHFRGLFPLKVFIGGPPVVGKTHFATKLAQSYGIPHLKIADMIQEAQQADDELAQEINAKIEELKDIELAAYEKTRKKKDPDLDRNTLKPRLPDEFLRKIVQAKVNSPACMNKGFILDGFPRNQADGIGIFLEKLPEADDYEGHPCPEAYPGYVRHSKILPEFVVMLEAEDAYLKGRAKEIAAMPQRQENHTEAQTDKRLKIYREANPGAQDPKHLFAFFTSVMDESQCMMRTVQPPQDEKTPQQVEQETLQEIQEFCERNGKPCCINLITEGDMKFLKSLEEKKEEQPAVTSAASQEDVQSQQ